MVELFEQDIRTNDRQSSKGNQLKWLSNGIWYKADYTGYEGLAEYMVSQLLNHTNLIKGNFIEYSTEQLHYGHVVYNGCSSKNFLEKGRQMITLERLFQSYFGESLNKSIYSIRNLEERIQFVVNNTIRITGLQFFGDYLSVLLTIDAFFLNEDRHTHNIAVLMDEQGKYDYCPIFDNGASLLSDTTMDYPINVDLEQLVPSVKAKTFCKKFDEQLDAVEKLYGQHLKFHFGRKEVEELLKREPFYAEEIKSRVETIILEQIRKYNYLFSDINKKQ